MRKAPASHTVATVLRQLLLMGVASCFACHSYALGSLPPGDWPSGTAVESGFKDISALTTIEAGGFIIVFSTPLDWACAASPAGNSAVYFYPGQNGQTADGIKIAYATALVAFATGKQVTVSYDATSSNCWGKYLQIRK